MKKRKLGKSGIEVSPMGWGCQAIGGNFFIKGMPLGWSTLDDNESLKTLQTFDVGDVEGHIVSLRKAGTNTLINVVET